MERKLMRKWSITREKSGVGVRLYSGFGQLILWVAHSAGPRFNKVYGCLSGESVPENREGLFWALKKGGIRILVNWAEIAAFFEPPLVELAAFKLSVERHAIGHSTKNWFRGQKFDAWQVFSTLLGGIECAKMTHSNICFCYRYQIGPQWNFVVLRYCRYRRWF